jgi:hypothetical protein
MPRTNRRKVKISVSISGFIYLKMKEVAEKLERSTSDVFEDAATRYLEQLSLITEKVHSNQEKT